MDRFLGVDLRSATVEDLDQVIQRGRNALKLDTVLVDEKLMHYVTMGICSSLAWRELARERDQVPG